VIFGTAPIVNRRYQTSIVVAHTSTSANADAILIIKSVLVIEQGSAIYLLFKN
jgi:ABC-type transport system involved in Fe-S cluster assembly fused permease/ATPase subunit